MRTAREIAAAAGLACAIAAPGVAMAGPDEADGDLYIVNGTGRSVELIVDSDQLGDLDRLGVRRLALHAGGHGVAVVADGQVVSMWEAFDAHNVALNAPGRPAWCASVEKDDASSGALRLELLDPHTCRLLIHDGGGPHEDVAGAER